ncbi:N-acetyl-gamma-glutamyl-phosphate reductase [Agrilactobacillus composti DSM 18527 = JCM 14202]|nr:N-acetyl-gamma-glutamyl-phosphate reductase [Agrilactobacillus composti DSM 18527 = JCM 14202]
MYKLNEHQHIPEIVQELQKFNSDLKAIQFSTTLIPVDRGSWPRFMPKPLPT